MSSAARITRPPARPAAVFVFDRPVRPFTVEEYHLLGEKGILTPNDRCELIHGVIVEKPVINPPHKKVLRRLQAQLPPLLGRDYVIDTQGPITLPDSEPEPDVSVSVGPEERYDSRNPGPGELVLVVEIADTTLDYDRGEKLELYARGKIPFYWIIDVNARRIEVHTRPRGGKNPTYRKKAEYRPGEAVPVSVGGKKLGTIPVSDLLP